MRTGLEFSPVMIAILFLAFMGISFFMGMLVHSAFVHEDKKNLKRDSKQAWVLSMTAGTGVTGWMFLYGDYINFFN